MDEEALVEPVKWRRGPEAIAAPWAGAGGLRLVATPRPRKREGFVMKPLRGFEQENHMN